MRAVAHGAALPDQVPCAAEAAFAEAKAFLCSREARQMSESDLERELHRRGQELVHKLLQGHLEQRSPREAAGPVEGADEEALEAHGDGGRRLHGRAVGAEPGGVPAELDATTAGGQDPGRAVSPRGETGLCEPGTGALGGGRRGDAGSRAPGPRAGQALGSRSSMGPRRSSTSSKRAPPHPRGKPVDTCADYLQKYAPYLHYDRYLAAGCSIATGVIEGACRYLVRDRMELTCARWRLVGAEAVLKLRPRRASRDFAYRDFHEARVPAEPRPAIR